MSYKGDFIEDATVRFKFTTHDGSGGAVAPSTGFEAADLKIYKDDSTDEKASADGVTITSAFDGVTGLHHVSIDTSDNTGAAGFWVAGADYDVVLDPSDETVDGETVVRVVADFSIENRFAEVDLVAILGTALTEGAGGRIAAAVKKLFDVVTPVLVASDVMRGTDNASLAAKLISYIQLMTRSDSGIKTDRATELAEINNNEGNGAGDWDNVTDAEEAIRDAIAAAAPVAYHPDASSVITVGNEDANTYADCAADNGTRWTIGDEDGSPTIDVICEINMGANRVATGLEINGYFDRGTGSGYITEIYAYNYTTSSWDKLSSGTADTEMRDRSSDADYVFSLGVEHTDPDTAPGEVKIRFQSTRDTTAAGDILYLDHVRVTGVAVAATSPQAIAHAVHTELDDHLSHVPLYTGTLRYVDGVTGSDDNTGHTPNDAFATITAAIAASGAGDAIHICACSYTEAVTVNLDGLELHCEIGADITGAGGTPLTVSSNKCKVLGLYVTPAAGQIGCIVSGDENHLEFCESHDSGAIGFQIAAAGQGNHLERCAVAEFTGTGFDIKGFNGIFHGCLARGNGGTEKGFHLSDTAAHRNFLSECATIDCATAGWTVDAGADDNLFHSCSDSDGCGTRVDNGANNAWQAFGDIATAVGALDVDSTGGEVVSLIKALELLVAAFGGKATYAAGTLTIYGRDDTTPILTIDLTGEGAKDIGVIG